MTPDERQLITSLFERMRGYGLPEKDREAETLINQAVRDMPDAPYMLVQSVLVQEQALEAATTRVQELEERVRALEQGAAQPRQGTGSFLGGLLGGAKPAAAQRSVSVPAIGSREPAPGAFPQAQQAQPATGGFMRSAMSTAAGVAGGVLLAESIRGMMGGQAHAKPAEAAKEPEAAKKEEPQETAHEDRDDDDVQETGDDGGDWGDGGDGGLDI